MVSRLLLFFFYDFSIESSCDVFMNICSYYNVSSLHFFCREHGGGVDGLSLRFILFLLHGLRGENRV